MSKAQTDDIVTNLSAIRSTDESLSDFADDTDWIDIEFAMASDDSMESFACPFHLEKIGDIVRLSAREEFFDHTAERLTELFQRSDAAKREQILDALTKFFPRSFRSRDDILALAQRTLNTPLTDSLTEKAVSFIAMIDWHSVRPALKDNLLTALKNTLSIQAARQWAIIGLRQAKDEPDVHTALLDARDHDPSPAVRADAREIVGLHLPDIRALISGTLQGLWTIVFGEPDAAPAFSSVTAPETVTGTFEQDGIAYDWLLSNQEGQRHFRVNATDPTLAGQVIIACLEDGGQIPFSGYILMRRGAGAPTILEGSLPVSVTATAPLYLIVVSPEDIVSEDIPLLYASFVADHNNGENQEDWDAWLENMQEDTLAEWNETRQRG